MELTHRLTYNGTTTTIQEPIGFDSLKVQISRHDYHGMGAESSMDALEFYGNAINIIRNAYATDIDSSIVYDVFDGSTVIYTGKLDLSTYKELRGDYHSISCQVGEIGAKTTFNNRTDTAIDLDDPKTVDGEEVIAPEWLELHIPKKSLLYTNFLKQTSDQRQPESGTIGIDSRVNRHVYLPIGETLNNEFGQIQQPYPFATDDPYNQDPQYTTDSDFEKKYGSNTIMHIDIKLSAIMYIDPAPSEQSVSVGFMLHAKDEDGNTLSGPYFFGGGMGEIEFEVELHGDLAASGGVKFFIELLFSQVGSYALPYDIYFMVQKGTYVKMTMYDTLEDDNIRTKMLLPFQALQTVTRAISENDLDIVSDWYVSMLSANPGGGALKAITNGYKIRGLFSDEENKRNMPLSFKDLIQSLDAQDCIGWGFAKESDMDVVRIERWDWFYQDTLLMELSNVAEINIEVDTNRIPTELQIGYKKYATQDQYNSIESPHGKRTFVSGIKAISKALMKESEFIADNYAIEETRRARTQVSETEETSYDESIFVFELIRISAQETYYAIGHTATDATNVGRASEFINAKLTPRHMASRWRDFLFSTNNNTPFRFTSGEINYRASFGVYPETQTDQGRTIKSLRPFSLTDPQVESDDITHTPAKFKAEKISFSYPLTIGQYNIIKNTPYGIIRVNDASGNSYDGWILDFKYTFQDGMADFTLIAKNNQVNE